MSALASPVHVRQCKLCTTELDAGTAQDFCCIGCRSLYGMLVASDLVGAHTEAREARRAAPKTAPRYEAFDTPSFHEQHVARRADGAAVVDLVLEGVHCSACLWLLEKLPRVQTGVLDARLDMPRATLRVVYAPDMVQLSAIATTLDRLGYAPHPARDASKQTVRKREDRALLMRMAVAGASTGNVMLLAVALYAGESTGMEPSTQMLLRWASLVATVPAIVYSADVFFRGALSSIRMRAAHIDLPLAISLLAGFVHGAVNTVRGSGTIYFDSVVGLIFALLASRYLHQKKQRAATDATDVLQSLAPSVAHRVRGDTTEDVPTASLAVDDIVEVRPGEVVPSDGRIVRGASTLDRALLTGESLPVAVRVSDDVHAGVTNLDEALHVAVHAVGADTRIARLLQGAENASAQRAPVVQLANKLASLFVIASMGLAVLTFALWLDDGVGVALDRAIALLIVTCPCALGLATPLAMSSAMARAAKRRLFIKGSDTLERLASARTVVFDKTGTLTTGKLAIAHWFGERWVRPLVGALEAKSRHPMGKALAVLDDASACVTSFEEHAGYGIRGCSKGHELRIGTYGWVIEQATCASIWKGVADALAENGVSPIVVACDGAVVAVTGLADTLRPESAAVVRALHELGVRVQLLSGDDARVAGRVARELGVDAYEGGATPERKLEVVKELERAGAVVMVGDGVNDAGALAAARVGIVVNGGAEASLAVADAYSGADSLTAITDMLTGARRTMAVIHTGFCCGLVYNLIGIALAMSGVVTPLIAAIIMPASSLTVVTLAYKRRTFAGSAS